MRLTLNSLTALRITRAIRRGQLLLSLQRRCDFVVPDPSPAPRWTRGRLAEGLSFLGDAAGFSEKQPLDVLVADKNLRLRAKGVRCACRTGAYPEGAFVDLGGGVVMSGPELLFVELARVMDPAVHLLLGMELCGRYVRDPMRPRDGDIVYDVEPVTSVERLRAFARQAHWIRGAELALETVDRIVENAWSPMESLLAALIVLPMRDLGYDLWPIELNPRKELGERLSCLSDADSRLPDIMFKGTTVGLNYDGEDHFRLHEIARAAVEADRHPEDPARARELDEAISDARRRIVSDKRRDRDLIALGLSVFSVTKEDLEERGGLDRVMMQVIEAIESEGGRYLGAQRLSMRNVSRAVARQEFVWSLMPGPNSSKARRRLVELRKELSHTREFEVVFELDGGAQGTISFVEL